MTPVSIKQLRATLWQKINRNSKAVRDKTGWQSQNTMVQTNVDTNKHEGFNLMFTNHGKENGRYPPRTKNTLWKEIATSTNKDHYLRSIVKTCKNTKRDLRFQLIEDIIVLYQRWNLIISASLQDRAISWYHSTFSILATQVSKRQQNPWSTEKVCKYHPVMSNLANLAKNKRHSQNMILYYQSCSWWLPAEHYVYTSWGNTLLKEKTKQVLISCASPWLIQQ
jgi:hypothetical protein